MKNELNFNNSENKAENNNFSICYRQYEIKAIIIKISKG